MERITFGILTVSDTCHRKEKQDTAGPKLEEELRRAYPSIAIKKRIVPDELPQIREALESWSGLKEYCNVIFTVGGTGFSPRDVTPEATRAVIDKEAPGIAVAMTVKSLGVTEMAMLSRAVCGIKNKTLIVNLPGSAKGAVECFGFVKGAISHAVALLEDNMDLVVRRHQELEGQEVFTESKVKLNNAAKRDRKSPYPKIEVSDALKVIFKECSPTLAIETIPFDQSCSRVLAEDVFANEPIPSFRASIKDGYAVKSANGPGDRVVKEVIAAGDKLNDTELKNGEVIRISTGAAVPLGADAVVQVEDTTLVQTSSDGAREEVIRINVTPTEGQDIRAVGSDVPADTIVLNKYSRITAASIGVLAMLGKTEVKVFRRASVGILSTGNEIRDPRDVLEPGQIRDCNKFTLMHQLRRYGYESMDCGTARDEPNSVKNALEKAFSVNEVVISTGGVSMGEFDVVKQVLLEDFDALIHFAQVNMKPGKPTTFSTFSYKGKKKIFFGLPGNPVSCGVTCILYVVPTLRWMERSKTVQFPIVRVEVTECLVNRDDRPEYHRVKIYSSGSTLQAVSTGKQISSRLNSLEGANGLVIIRKTKAIATRSPFEAVEFGDPIPRDRGAASRIQQAIVFDDLAIWDEK